MQIVDDVEVGQTVNNIANVLYQDGSGSSTASMEISHSDFSAKARNNANATVTVFGGTKASVDDTAWNEIVGITYTTTYA